MRNKTFTFYNKLFSFLLGAIFCISTQVYTQAFIMLPADGIGDLGASTSQIAPTPYRSDQDHNRFQTIYTRDNLLAGGAPTSGPVDILSVGFHIAQVINAPFYTSGTGLVNYTIKMRNIPVNVTAVGNAFQPIDNSHIVKQPFNLNASVISTTGFHDFILDAPFVWDGVGNILIDVCYGINDGIASANNTRGMVRLHSWNNFTISNISRREFSSTPMNICNSTGNNVQQANHKPVARLGFVPANQTPTCPISVSPSVISICQGQQVNLNVSGASTYQWSNANILSCTTCNNPVATPTENTTIQVIGFNGQCSDTAFVTIQVNTPGNLVLTQQPANAMNLCQGPVTLTVPAGFSNIQWSNGTSQTSQLVVTNPGTYFATAVDPNGCTVTSQNITIQGANIPQVTIESLSAPYLCQGSVTLQANQGLSNYLWSNGATGSQIQISEPGIYSVTAQNADGCIGQSNQIEIFPAYTPEVLINASNTLICQGQSVSIFTTQSFQQYAWSQGGNGPSITVNSPGNYTLTATDQNGCSGTSESIQIENMPTPTAQFTYDQNEGYLIEFSSTSSHANDYLWIFHNGSTSNLINPVFEYPFDGFYQVTLIVTNECGSDTLVSMIEVKKLSVHDFLISPLNVFPNPASDWLSVKIDDAHISHAAIYNALGQIVLKAAFESPNTEGNLLFSIQQLNPGAYFIKFTSPKNQYVARFTKE